MAKRTKIVATLGPATDNEDVLEQMFNAGLDVVRINFSHGNKEDRARRVQLVRRIAERLNRDVGILGDLQGPKIRIRRFKDGPVQLVEGARFELDAARERDAGDVHGVGVTYEQLPSDVEAGDRLLLNDGQIVLSVVETAGSRVICNVVVGGELSDSKGINRLGGGLSAGALTEKDLEDMDEAAELDMDYLAISFPRTGADIEKARELFKKAGGKGLICAKIERAEAVTNIDDIIAVSDVLMVARGDLGVEIGDAALPGVQKDIIERTRTANRIVITATQMMESMVNSPLPTRAEVLDVANAVMDGTDAVMLSQETAVGHYPVKVVEAMARVCVGAEKHRSTIVSTHRLDTSFEFIDEAIAMATMYTANHLDVKAIVALTESGSTTLWMSRIRSGIPVFALTRHERTRRKVTLYRGVYPVPFDPVSPEPDKLEANILDEMRRRKAVEPGDWIIFTKGALHGIAGGTNAMKIISA